MKSRIAEVQMTTDEFGEPHLFFVDGEGELNHYQPSPCSLRRVLSALHALPGRWEVKRDRFGCWEVDFIVGGQV